MGLSRADFERAVVAKFDASNLFLNMAPVEPYKQNQRQREETKTEDAENRQQGLPVRGLDDRAITTPTTASSTTDSSVTSNIFVVPRSVRPAAGRRRRASVPGDT